jgi:amino acid adenylation domain-containing protein
MHSNSVLPLVHQQFERQATRLPEKIAVVDPSSTNLTYAQLNRRANQLAHRLLALGVRPDCVVGLCVRRSSDMLVALLGILKSGGAYLPLDPAYPRERLEYILRDARVSILVTHSEIVDRLPAGAGHPICLDSDSANLDQESDANPCVVPDSSNLAYVIYTSGSTGKPKGVMIEHRSLASFTRTACAAYGLGPLDRALQFASIAFDASAEEIYPALVRGSTLVLRTDAMLESIQSFLEVCQAHAITVLNLPTAYWHQLVASLDASSGALPESVRMVIIGGEAALPESLATWRRLVRAHLRLVNTYGPTEATVVATRCDLGSARDLDGSSVPIGHPARGTRAYVLDAHLNPVPVGQSGELYLAGDGLSRGYLDRPDLTAERFVPNPLVRHDPGGGSRLYRTGDLVRRHWDDTLEFLGRVDFQVKIRGFRVELGEIEAALHRHPAVDQAVVLALPDGAVPGERRLVAYVVPAQSSAPDTQGLRAHLSEQLPEYMIPASFALLAHLPLTVNGKVDRDALPRVATPRACPRGGAGAVEAPRSSTEGLLVRIWEEVLGVEPIGVHDNFFELGGYSLKAIQVMSRVRDELGVELPPLNSLLEGPTVARLAELVSLSQLQQADSSLLASLLEEVRRQR